LFGSIVGLSLGLTGGGGAIFAVPLLVYGLSLAPREAVGISLASVGAMAAVGAAARWRKRQVEPLTALWFAIAGMASAPVGVMLAKQIPDQALLTMFSILMFVVALRMWRRASRGNSHADDPTAACRREPEGALRLTSRCAVVLVLLGLATGLIAGMFGVGGGFVIVPALVLMTHMSMQRAIGTSLVVIAMISAAGVSASLLNGADFSAGTATLFSLGGVVGMLAGTEIGKRLSTPALQRTFAIAIATVALFVVFRSNV
jgi:uncharacterized membrane protein YfcA